MNKKKEHLKNNKGRRGGKTTPRGRRGNKNEPALLTRKRGVM